MFILLDAVKINGWKACDLFTSFSTVFQSYYDDGRLLMKIVCSETSFTVGRISLRPGLELGTVWSEGQRLTHWTTGAPKF